MITELQIQWLVATYQEVNAILDKIPDFDSNYKYQKVDANFFKKGVPFDHDFFYDEYNGFYEVLYLDHGDTHQIIYGKSKREIIQYIVNGRIFEEAYHHYAYKKYREECYKRHIDPETDTTFAPQYFIFGKERENDCHSIVDHYIETIEDSNFPSGSTNKANETIKALEKHKFLSVNLGNGKLIVKVYVPDIAGYSHCKLDIYKKNGDLIRTYIISQIESEYSISTPVKDFYVFLIANNSILASLDINNNAEITNIQ